GVAAPGFHYPATADLWLPVGLIPENSHRTAHNYTVVGRVKPDIAVMTAGEELRIIGDRLERQHPENRFKSVAITPLQGRLTRSVQSTLWVLLGAVALVLLIACANVANLLLARATARTREIALRTAVGASRSRIVRQLVTESMMLGACSSGLGVVIALLALDGLLLLAPPSVPGLDRVTLDARVLVFSLGVGILSSLLFGLAPAIQASRVDLNTALRASGGKGAVGSGHSARTRSVLVVAEIALSVVLLIGAGLLLRSYQALTRVDLGFATERTLIAQISTPAADEAAAQRATHFRRTLIENDRNLPGVTGAAGTWATPLGEIRSNAAYFIQGRPAGRPGEYSFADMHVVSPGYFRTMGIELVRGRDFNGSDEFGRPQVVIVNEAFVRTAFEKADPLGHRLRTGFTLESAEGMQIIGVARDIRASDPGTPASPELYLPYLQHPSVGSRLALVIRTGLEPSALEEAIRSTIKRLDPEVPVRFQTMEAVHARALSYPRFRTLLITCFAVLAAVLAAIGIYSVLAYLVSQRTAEIGVRIALGADANDVLRLVAGNALRLTAVGLAAGAVVAWAASKALASMVYGISPGDPVTYLGAVLVTGLSATLASTAPAMRATRIDPVVALRQD
ncbi:MAG TPA: ADOP family duplicated permease, partial [Bryobacteraceae bacterium]|nr:ADOP family duplicated permease [Bryobacteraceae bacterium]